MLQASFSTILDISKVFYGLLDCILFLFGLDLLLRYFKVEKSIRGEPAYFTILIIAIGILGDGVYTIFAILDYVYTPSIWGYGMQALCPMVILTLMAFLGENLVYTLKKAIKIGKFRVGVLSIIGFGVSCYACGLTIYHIINGNNTWDVPTIIPFVPIYLAIIVYGFIDFLVIVNIFFYRFHPRQEIKVSVKYAFECGIVIFLGVCIRSLGEDIFSSTLYELFLVGLIVEIGGWFGMRHFLLSIRSFGELSGQPDQVAAVPFNQQHFVQFFSDPLNENQFKELQLRFSRREGPGKPPRGEFSAIILLFLNNPDIFGIKICKKKILMDAVAYALTNVLNIETNPERIRKNTVHHLDKLKEMKIIDEDGDFLVLNPNWQVNLMDSR